MVPYTTWSHLGSILNMVPITHIQHGLNEASHSLAHLDGVALESKDIVREDDYFVVALLVEAHQELTGAELVGIHRIEELKQTMSMCIHTHARTHSHLPTP